MLLLSSASDNSKVEIHEMDSSSAMRRANAAAVVTTYGRWGRRRPLRFFFQLESGKHPAHGSVSERPNVGEAEAAQRGGADDAARAPGAIDDDICRLALLQFFGPENQVTARNIDAAGNAKPAVLLRSANIENNQIRRTILQ